MSTANPQYLGGAPGGAQLGRDTFIANRLLMTLDRAHSDSFSMTQEFLAYALGMRRVGVTQAAQALQRRNLIRYTRGTITVIDRCGLEAVACNCYLQETRTYARFMT